MSDRRGSHLTGHETLPPHTVEALGQAVTKVLTEHGAIGLAHLSFSVGAIRAGDVLAVSVQVVGKELT